MNYTTELNRLVEAVQQAGADIAPTYAEYIQLAFAIATDCGEAGRSAFHQICAFSSKYQAAHADKVYTNVLKQNKGDVHLGTAFYLAEQCGVKLAAPSNGAMVQGAADPYMHTRARVINNGEETTETLSGCDPIMPLPCLDDYSWPEPVGSILSFAKTRPQRDALLLGAFTVLGASLERHVRFPYGGRLLSPCMQTFIVAPPASGKGMLSLLRLMVAPLHEEMRSKYEKEWAKYRVEKAAYDSMGRERAKMAPPQKPKNRMFIIAGNNSGTGILQNLMDADGTGLIFETEADTISTAIGSDFGHWSDTLRKAFDHDPLAYNRRLDNEYREVVKSYLSVLLSGTPAQVKPLIPSVENGLFSRQIFYYMPGIREWQDQFDPDDTDLEPLFRNMGKEWKKRLDDWKSKGVYTLRLSVGQKQTFNRQFADLFARSGMNYDYEMSSSIARLAINLCRILSVMAMLRGDFRPDSEIPSDNLKDGIIQRWDVFLCDADFDAVMGLLDPLYRHVTHILSLLPATEITRRDNSDSESFFAALPTVFTKGKFNELAKEWNVNPNTVESWLKRAMKRGAIERTEVRGEYRKR